MYGCMYVCMCTHLKVWRKVDEPRLLEQRHVIAVDTKLLNQGLSVDGGRREREMCEREMKISAFIDCKVLIYIYIYIYVEARGCSWSHLGWVCRFCGIL